MVKQIEFGPIFLRKFDEEITRLCRSLWEKSVWLDASAIIVAKWTPLVMLAVYCAASTSLSVAAKHHSATTLAAASGIISAVGIRLVNEPIGRFVNRPRPFEMKHFTPLLGHERGKSLPSNHATGAFALATSFHMIPMYSTVLYVLAILLSVSRVYTGLHHTSDVIVGALHGILSAKIVQLTVTPLLAMVLH